MNVFKEAQKAETALKNLDKRAYAALTHCREKWSIKREGFIRSLDIQVRAALRGAAVIDGGESAVFSELDETPDEKQAES